MLKICYILANLCEMTLGIVILNKIYPEFRFKSGVMKGLAIVLFCVAGFLYAGNAWLFFISTSFGILASAVLAGVYRLFWKSNFLNNYLFLLFYYINMSLLKLPILIMRGIRCNQDTMSVNHEMRTFEEVACIIIILALIYLVLKYNKNAEVILRKMFIESTTLCAVIVVLELFLLCYCMHNGSMGFETKDLISNFISILCVSMMLTSIVLFFTYQKVQTENLLQQEIYKCMKNQYYEMKELYESNSRWVHDVKHELILVGNCLEEKDLSGAYDSVQGYLQRIKQTEKKVWSNFTFLDFMLNYKKAEMDKKGIKFMLNIELQHINIPEEDLVICIGNLLDNAIEAACKCEQGKRYINLKIHNLNEMLLLCIENSSAEMPQRKKEVFISTKKDNDVHGWGIKSVKQIVESYGGEISFRYDENYFQVEILI